MSRQTIIVANWKMHGLEHILSGWSADLMALQVPEKIAVIAALPYPYLKTELPKFVSLSAQDCHAMSEGAFTGDVSAGMLKDIGVKYVIVGHSERRHRAGESDEMVKQKAQVSLSAGLIPIICVGENLQMRESGEAEKFTLQQLQNSLPNSDNIIVAYEPIWAIGTGQSATVDDAQTMHAALRGQVGDSIPILYGGSVNADNAGEYMQQPDVDGVLVGSASMDSKSFADIIKSAF